MVNENVHDPFWKRIALEDMSTEQWESLCDGCGRCCLLKLEDEDSGALYLTRLSCRLLDLGTCRCTHYAERQAHVADCVTLTPETARSLPWLPATCAYRLVAEGKDLAWWHPLISGDPQTVHQAGISVRTWAKSEARVDPDAIARYIVEDFGPPRKHPARSSHGRPRSGRPRAPV